MVNNPSTQPHPFLDRLHLEKRMVILNAGDVVELEIRSICPGINHRKPRRSGSPALFN